MNNDIDNDIAKRLPSMMELLRQLMKHIRNEIEWKLFAALHDRTESGPLSIIWALKVVFSIYTMLFSAWCDRSGTFTWWMLRISYLFYREGIDREARTLSEVTWGSAAHSQCLLMTLMMIYRVFHSLWGLIFRKSWITAWAQVWHTQA